MYSSKDHTFVVCAYKESAYIEDCIKSVVNQNVRSNIIVTTSTPNKFIENLVEKYNLDLIINNSGRKGVVEDWNFGYKIAKTRFVTICHQDDIYCEKYLENFLEKVNKSKKMLIYFTDYYELRRGGKVDKNLLLLIKKILLFPLRFRCLWKSKRIRKIILSFGSSICCPSVTFNKQEIKNDIFTDKYKCVLDWEAWLRLSNLDGEFIYCSKALICHRIHEESLTTQVIEDNTRKIEEVEIFKQLWPTFIAGIIAKIYNNGIKSNKL